MLPRRRPRRGTIHSDRRSATDVKIGDVDSQGGGDGDDSDWDEAVEGVEMEGDHDHGEGLHVRASKGLPAHLFYL